MFNLWSRDLGIPIRPSGLGKASSAVSAPVSCAALSKGCRKVSAMSLESWKKEFYPRGAGLFAYATDEQVIRHSLVKWNGLTKENLAKHGVSRKNNVLHDDTQEEFFINGDTCAMCVKDNPNSCKSCSYMKHFGIACDEEGESQPISPYMQFANGGSPDLMIAKLEELLEVVVTTGIAEESDGDK
jgi:hypothetical protein